MEMLTYQLQFELWDIYTAVKEEKQPKNIKTNVPRVMDSHCSSLVRLSDDGKKLFAAHDTWSDFSSMLRVYKYYKLAYSEISTRATTVAFSSFPATLPSGDDYYITSENLVVMETTNGVMNESLFSYVTEQTVPWWIRIIVANRIASSAADWVQSFSQFNSGTYNNQWIVIDYKKFHPGEQLANGTLWIAEQIPGYIVSSDMTSHLASKRFWASYNIPYYPFIYNISGYPEYYKKYGNTYSHDQCARAKIFRRDQGAVQTMEDMKRIMRYNEYQTDSLSLKDACRGISARCDLNAPWAEHTLNKYSAFGAIDAKITDNSLSTAMGTMAVSGPSWDSQPVFAWSHQWPYVPRYSQPDIFNFQFEYLAPAF